MSDVSSFDPLRAVRTRECGVKGINRRTAVGHDAMMQRLRC